jgi:hypothetical protein
VLGKRDAPLFILFLHLGSGRECPQGFEHGARPARALTSGPGSAKHLEGRGKATWKWGGMSGRILVSKVFPKVPHLCFERKVNSQSRIK